MALSAHDGPCCICEQLSFTGTTCMCWKNCPRATPTIERVSNTRKLHACVVQITLEIRFIVIVQYVLESLEMRFIEKSTVSHITAKITLVNCNGSEPT